MGTMTDTYNLTTASIYNVSKIYLMYFVAYNIDVITFILNWFGIIKSNAIYLLWSTDIDSMQYELLWLHYTQSVTGYFTPQRNSKPWIMVKWNIKWHSNGATTDTINSLLKASQTCCSRPNCINLTDGCIFALVQFQMDRILYIQLNNTKFIHSK